MMPDTPYDYRPIFLAQSEADELLSVLEGLAYKRGKTQYGAHKLRAELTFGALTGRTAKADTLPLSCAPLAVLSVLEKATRFTGRPLNRVTLQKYENGHDSISYHQHKDDHMGVRKNDQSVVLISLGATRQWGLRPLGTKDSTKLDAKHGSLLYLHHECNRTHEHAVIQTAKPTGTRYCINAYYVPVGVAAGLDGGQG